MIDELWIGLIPHCLFCAILSFAPFIKTKTGKEATLLLMTFLGGAMCMFATIRLIKG